MKKTLLLKRILAFLLFGFVANAQSISGVVSSTKEGLLPGVSVAIKGTTIGTISDIDGKFALQAPSTSSIIVFSAIGFNTQEEVVGNKTSFDINLLIDNKVLNEVVVTALGISREKKSLGFSQQEISGAALTEARSNNVVNGLSGKVAGVRIGSNGGPGSGS
ncbi:MAG: hypothetical protein ACI97P_002233, partial [Arcticibacterium sp.]